MQNKKKLKKNSDLIFPTYLKAILQFLCLRSWRGKTKTTSHAYLFIFFPSTEPLGRAASPSVQDLSS